jgi:putative PIN family toxin of toxin-antitoxin system
VSKLTTEELLRVLAYPKFGLSAADQQELLADYLPYCTTVAIPDKLPKIPACRDAFDIPFLQLAIAGKADFLVRGDRDILSLKGEFACPIVAAEEFLAVFANSGASWTLIPAEAGQ